MKNLKCMLNKHEYDIYLVGRCRIAHCNKCNKYGIVSYKVDMCIVTNEVEWLSNKKLDKYLKEDTIMAKAIQTIYNKLEKGEEIK